VAGSDSVRDGISTTCWARTEKIWLVLTDGVAKGMEESNQSENECASRSASEDAQGDCVTHV